MIRSLQMPSSVTSLSGWVAPRLEQLKAPALQLGVELIVLVAVRADGVVDIGRRGIVVKR